MITLGVLCSGSGSNLQSILDAIADERLDAKVGLVLCNVPDAYALERARRAGVPAVVLEHKRFRDRASFDESVVLALKAAGVELVVLAGFMRIVTKVLLDAFPTRVVNIHPALLPAFPGVNGPGQALRYGVRIAGCTVHFVDGGTDTGPIIAQAAVPVLEEDTEETLRSRILGEEHAILPRVLQWFAEGRLRVEPPSEPGARPRVRVHGARTAFGLAEE